MTQQTQTDVVIDDVDMSIKPPRCAITVDGMKLVAFSPYTHARIETGHLPASLRGRGLIVAITGNARTGSIRPVYIPAAGGDGNFYYLSKDDAKFLFGRQKAVGSVQTDAARVLAALSAADAALAKCDIASTSPTAESPMGLADNILFGGSAPEKILVEPVEWDVGSRRVRINAMCLNDDMFWSIRQVGEALGYEGDTGSQAFRLKLRSLPAECIRVICGPAVECVYRWMRAHGVIASTVRSPTTVMLLTRDGVHRALVAADSECAQNLLLRLDTVSRRILAEREAAKAAVNAEPTTQQRSEPVVATPAPITPAVPVISRTPPVVHEVPAPPVPVISRTPPIVHVVPAPAPHTVPVVAPPPPPPPPTLAACMSSLPPGFAIMLPRLPGADYQILRVNDRRYAFFDDDQMTPRVPRSTIGPMLNRSSSEIRRAIRDLDMPTKRTARISSGNEGEACFTAREIRVIADRIRSRADNAMATKIRGELATFARSLATPECARWDSPKIESVVIEGIGGDAEGSGVPPVKRLDIFMSSSTAPLLPVDHAAPQELSGDGIELLAGLERRLTAVEDRLERKMVDGDASSRIAALERRIATLAPGVAAVESDGTGAAPGCFKNAVVRLADDTLVLPSDTVAAALGMPHSSIVAMADELMSDEQIMVWQRGNDGRWIEKAGMTTLLVAIGGKTAAKLVKILIDAKNT